MSQPMLNVRTPARRAAPHPAGGAAGGGGRSGGGEFLGELGSMIHSGVAAAISGLSLNTGAEENGDHQPMSMGSQVSAPRTLDAMFAERARERDARKSDAKSPGDELSDGDCGSWCSEDSGASSVQLADGTDAMVRYLRKGIGALECPVCSQLLTQPVTPAKSTGGCACSFCLDCIGKMLAVNVVDGICRCPKCYLEVPTDIADYSHNVEIQGTIEEFQRQGGEAAEYTTMMLELTKSQEARREKYPKLTMSEFTLDPKPLATGAYGQVLPPLPPSVRPSLSPARLNP